MVKVAISRVIDAPVDRVWAVVRDFNSLPQWHPRMVASEIEDGKAADQIGCVRKFTLASGPVLREKLVAMSDDDYSLTYQILETPQPITNHRATLKLTPISSGGTFAEWSSDFDAPEGEADGIASGMGENVFGKGLEALGAHVTGK